MRKRVSILCSSFPPETGAAPGRMQHLAALLSQNGYEVTVITAMPNYPTGSIFPAYRGKLWHRENVNGISIFRTWLLPSHSNNRLHRTLSMLSYTLSLYLLALPRLIRSKPSLMMISSPPFVTGYFGLLMGRLTRSKVLLNVSDLWPQSALELGFLKKGRFYRWLERRERRMYQLADVFTVQSEEIRRHILKQEHNKPILLYRNLQEEQALAFQQRPAGKRKLVYAGLLGVAQGVYAICEAIDFAAAGTELHIYGAGNEQEKITAFSSEHPHRGVIYHGSADSALIPQILTQYHAMLIPLRNHIHGAVPSKIFNAMANGLPILFSGDGEAADIIANTGTGLVSSAGNYSTLLQNIRTLLAMNDADYERLRQNCYQQSNGPFNRTVQDKAFLEFLDSIE